MSSAAAQYRNEKKRIEEAVAKVREVVHSASKNDIILALHNYDLDVNRTIQAFCDDGAQSALDSWARSGAATTKKGHKKKKGLSVPTLVSAAPLNGLSDLRNGSPTMSDIPVTNSSQMTMNIVNAAPSTTTFEGRTASVPAKQALPASASARSMQSTFSAPDGFAVEMCELKKRAAEIEKIEAAFDGELSISEDNVRNAFKVIRELLADRESHLLAELKRSHDDCARMLNDRRVQACELNERGERIGAMSDREQAELREEMIRFTTDMQWETDIGNATRFLYDNTQLIKLIKNFGEVVGKKGGASQCASNPSNGVAAQAGPANTAAGTIKHSVSHSSIVSSLGEDSGFGQISPIASEERKNVVEVSNGGIVMKSDSLSADQLEDLNKKLQETLKAQGIDLSILPNIGGAAAMPVRRRPPGAARGARGGPAAVTRRHLPQHAVRMPELSILQS